MVHAEWEGTILGPYWDAICNCRLSELQEILKIILSNSFILQMGKLSPEEGAGWGEGRNLSKVTDLGGDTAGTRMWTFCLSGCFHVATVPLLVL